MSILVDKILSTENYSVNQIFGTKVRFILSSILFLISQLWIIKSCLVRWMVFLPMVECKNCVVHAADESKVVAQGLDGYMVAEKHG